MSAGIAVITGAAGGMGEFITRKLHKEGYKVVLADLNLEGAQAIADDLSADGSTAQAYKLDVSKKAEFKALVEHLENGWGIPTVLVNNAAVTKAAPVLELDDEEFDQVLNINVNSIFFGCQVVGQAMAKAGFGRIINMASLAGQNGGTATGAHYAASKGSILTITKIFAKEFARQGVTVNAISPGPHDLPIVHQTVPGEKLNAVLETIPVGKLGDPGFIADTVALLSAENAGFVTGACWDINGGLFVR